MRSQKIRWWQRYKLQTNAAVSRAASSLRGRQTQSRGGKLDRSLRLSELETRLLFSATPIDPAMMDAATMEAAEEPQIVQVETMQTESISDFGSQSEIQQQATSVVFIDGSVPDLQQMLDDLAANRPDTDVIVLDTSSDGVDQISDYLDSRSGIESVHIVSHGDAGSITLGNVDLTNETIAGYAGQIAAWQSSLTSDADILIYGCDVASSDGGITLVDSIASLTGADVAASDDNTGTNLLLGDWEFEYHTGSIETGIAFSDQLTESWNHLLNVSIIDTSFATIEEDDTSVAFGHYSSGTDRHLIVGISIAHADGVSVTNVQFGGEDLVFVGSQSDGGSDKARVEIWQLINPVDAVSTLDVSVNHSNHEGVSVVAVTFDGVDQATPTYGFSGTGGDDDNGTLADQSLATSSYFSIASVDDGGSLTITPTSGQSVLASPSEDHIHTKAGFQVGASNVTSAWNFSNSKPFAIAGLSINSVAHHEIIVDSVSDYSTGDSQYGDTRSIAALIADKGSDGLITLREAIDAANNTTNAGGVDTISFDIVGSGPHVVNLIESLPEITDSVLIDGWSEPDFVASPVIELNGSGAGATTNGFYVSAGNSTIRGLAIHSFGHSGIWVRSGDNNNFQGNYIGTDTTGIAVLGNGRDGIATANSSDNLIGGVGVNDANLIVNNGRSGVRIYDDSPTNPGYDNRIIGNFIGVGLDGTTDFGNGFDGIRIDQYGGRTQIGGVSPQEGNTIAFNDLDQINVTSTVGNSIRGNSLFGFAGGTGIGIDLDGNDGTDTNDLPDSDSGPNDGQNYPVITQANHDGTTATIQANVSGDANTLYHIDFYATTNDTGAVHGEAEHFLGSNSVTTDGSGNAVITYTNTTFTFTGSHLVTATATSDATGSTSELARSLQVNLAPTAISVATDNVDENTDTSGGFNLGMLATTDPNSGDSFTYQIESVNDFAFFSLAGAGSNELVLTNGTLDHETKESYSVDVTVTDSGGLQHTETLTILVNDLNEPVSSVTDVNSGNNEIFEDATAGTVVGITATASDDDDGDVVTYTLDEDASGRFSIDLNSGVVTLSGSIDYEDETSHAITVRATSSGGGSSTQGFTINVLNRNDESPVIDTPSPVLTVSESAQDGDSVGTLTATDADSSTFSNWMITGGNTGNVFAIDGTTGEITINDRSTLDYETATTYTLSVTTSDGTNTSATKSITVNVTNESAFVITIDTVTDNNDAGSVDVEGLVFGDGGTDGQISLREAIAAVNDSGNPVGAYRIEFDLGAGAQVINLNSALSDLTITRAVTIDATTHAGHASGDRVILDGLGTMNDGLVLTDSADGSEIRGLTIRNVFNNGITILDNSNDHLISDNWIGAFDNDGTFNTGLGNDGSGIYVLGDNVTIGGMNVADRNVLSGNQTHGVMVTGDAAGTTIAGNYIGTAQDGVSNMRNLQDGIRVEGTSQNTTIGGTGNVISFNNFNGVTVDGSASGVTIRGNLIQNNNRIGIDIGDDGSTPNDPDDVDTGANDKLNTPILSNVYWNGTTLSFDADLDVASGGLYTIDLYGNSELPIQQGVAEYILGSETAISVPGTGDYSGSFSFSPITNPTLGDNIVATLTDANGNTSEFSLNVTLLVAPTPPSVSTIEGSTLSYTENDSATNITSTLQVSDPDDVIISATIAIAANFVSGQDILGFVNTGNITSSFNSTTGVLTLNGVDTVANYEAALRSVTYQNTSEDPDTLDRDIEFSVFDGISSSGTQTRSISVTSVNDATTISMSQTVNDLDEDQDNTSDIQIATFSYSDVDANNSVYRLGGADAAMFALSPDGATLTLKNGFSLDAATNPTLDVEVIADDPGIPGTEDTVQLVQVTVNNLNLPPTIDLSTNTATLPENSPSGTSTFLATITVTDDGDGTNNVGVGGPNNGLFEIVDTGMSLELHLRAGISLDHEAKSTISVNVGVNDPSIGSGPEDIEAFTLHVTDNNDVATGKPLITGTARVGSKLTANNGSVADQDGLGTFSYQWYRGTDLITGATESTYELTADDLGKKMRVVLTFTDAGGSSEGPLISDPTDRVKRPIGTIPGGGPGTGGDAGSGDGDSGDGDSGDSGSGDSDSDTGDGDSSDDGSSSSDSDDGNSAAAVASAIRASDQDVGSGQAFESVNLDETNSATGNEASAATLAEQAEAQRQSQRSTSSRNAAASGQVSSDSVSTIQGFSFDTSQNLSTEQIALLTGPGKMWDALDGSKDDIESAIRNDYIVAGTAGAAASSITVGVIAWTLRSGVLLSGLLAHLPAWRAIDPLTFMQGAGGGAGGESLEELMQRQNETLENNELTT